MKNTKSTAPAFPIARRKLYLAIAAQMLIAAGAHANPTGGVVVAGDGQIDQSGLDTTVTQTSERMAIDWASFNIQADERVQFIQPGETSVALNRILGSEASQIFGRLDANGHVILMNPNGVLFGESATVNVGGLVASGLAINPDDFMNGDFALSAVEGMDGAVINQGIIHAATGGNVALIGKSVENQGLISAKLGSVTLAAGKEAVLTFDNQGLLGIRVTKEILQNELGVEAAVTNSGEIKADGGRILLTGSVSQDIFSRAVNSEGLNAKTSVVMHDDGSFTLGAGANVVNTGTLNAGSDDVTITAGHIAVLGENVNHSGTILAASTNSGAAGNIELHSRDTTLLTATSTLNASAKKQGQGGNIKVLGDRVGVFDSSQINASGVNGGGDIHIGGGFQGKNPGLRNASRTVVGKNTLINADALENGNGGEVIVWADKATAFTGEINVRGGANGGDGGFVEVSGKENLKFDGKVDRTAVEGKSGILLLDPETISIVSGNNGNTTVDAVLVAEREILFTDAVPANSNISATALRDSLLNGNTILEATGDILFESGSVVDVLANDSANIASLVVNAGGNIQMQHNALLNVGGDVLFNAGVAECGGALCNQYGSGAILIAVGAFVGSPPTGFGDPEGGISALGDVVLRAADRIQLEGDLSGSALELRAGGEINLSSLPGNISSLISQNGNVEIHAGDNTVQSSGTSTVPLGQTEYVLPALRLKTSEADSALTFNGTTQSLLVQVNSGDLIVSAKDSIAGYMPEISILDGNITIESFEGDIVLFSPVLTISKTPLFAESAEILVRAAGNIDSSVNDIKANVVWEADADQNGLGDISISNGIKITDGSFIARATNFSFLGTGSGSNFLEVEGPVYLAADNDLNLPAIWAGGDVYLISENGSVIFESSTDASIAMAGNSQFIAGRDVIFSGSIIDSSEAGEAPLNIRFDVGGNLLLESPNNEISSIEILSVQNVVLVNRTDLNITGINALNLRLDTQGNVSQSGPINISRESEFNISGVASLTLAHAGNDFNLLTISSDSPNSIRLNDLNDLALGNIEVAGTLQLTAGAEGRISQNANSIFDLNPNALLILNAGHIDLGESGSRIEMDNAAINLTANRSMSFSGVISGLAASQLKAFGSTSDGIQVDINEGAIFSGLDPDLSFISLGAGNDVVNIASDVGFDIDTFAGDDTISILTSGLQVSSIDGGAGEDTLVGSDGDAQWQIGHDHDFALNILTDSEKTIVFGGIENLVGGDGSDHFSFLNEESNVYLIGSNGVEEVDGGLGSNHLAVNAFTLWEIGLQDGIVTGQNGSPALNFSSITSVSALVGTFKVSDSESVVKSYRDDSNSGTLDFSELEGSLAFDILDPIFSLIGIAAVVGNGVEGVISALNESAIWKVIGSLQETSGYIGSIYIGEDRLQRQNIIENADFRFYNFGSINSGAGNDDFVMDAAEIDFDLNINGGSGSNTLAADSAANVWTIDGINSGALNTQIVFQDIQNLEGNAGNDTFTFAPNSSIGNINAGAGGDTFILANNITTGLLNGGDGQDTLNRNGLNSIYTYLNQVIGGDAIYTAANIEIETNAGGSTTVVAVDGYDAEWTIDGEGSISVTATDSGGASVINRFNSVARLEGGSGGDEFILLPGGAIAGGIFGSGDDTLQASDTTNAWTINAANSGQLVAQENATTIIFEGIANLIGGAGSDAFNVLSGGSISGSIDGGAGTDTLQISDTAATNSWQLGLQNSLGLVNQFRGIENLTGNANNDTFAFTAVSDVRKIEGQGGDNTLDWSADEVVINLCGCVESNNIEFKNIQSVIANSSFNNTIIGLNEANTWTLTGPDAGTVNNIRFAGFKSLQGGTAEDTLVGFAAEQTWRIGSGDNPEVHSLSSADGQVSFRNMESLLGGAGADTFYIDTSGASISPAINGGGGVNVIFANDNNQTDNTWIIDGINSGLLNEGVRFTNIQNLEGNDGIDTVTFAIDAVIENIRTNGGDDLVHMADGVTAGLLDGGLGNNVLRLSGLSTVVDILARPIPGDDSYDAINFVVDTTDGGFVTVRGLADLDTEWLIDGDGTLTVRYLDEQGQLQSVFHPNVARLEGANGKNTFVLLEGGELFDPIVGNGSDTLRVENNLANKWIVNNPNAGQVTTDAGLTQLFEGIANLIGGTGDDTFDIVTGGSISSSIDGRAGADTFTLAPSTSVSEIFGGLGNDSFFIGRDVAADNFFGDAGDDSFDVDVGLTLSGALDGGSGEEVAGDYLNLIKYTVLTASSDLESLLGFTFRNFERIDQPNNQGVYTGGDATNFWYITGANQGRLEIRDGANAGVYEFSGVHSLLGGSGEDIFIFADDTAAITTIIDGGVGDGTNTLDLSAQGLINQWLIDGANSGRVINASNSTGSVFTNIAYLIGGGGQDVFNVQAGGAIAGGVDGGLGDDQLTIASTQASTWTLGDTPGNTVTGIASFGNIETLVGSVGEDIFNVLSETLDVARVDGAGGSDTLNFQHASPVEVDLRNGLAGGLQFSAIERFITGNIGSTLIAADASNNWTLDGADSGTIRYLISTGGELINVAFDGFGNLLGGAANDQFNLQAGASVSGAIDAGAGNDELNLQAMTTDVHVTATAGVALPTGVPGLRLNGVEQLLGNGRTWLYGASDQSYTWTINGPRSGQVTATLVDADNQLLAFENLSAIVGGAHDDVFQVTVATPLISLDGGSAVSADLVDYSQVNGNLRINLATALSGQNGVLTGVEGIRGNNAGPDSIHTAELVGADGENSWTVGAIGSALADGINDGQVTSAGQTIQFLDFNVLTGGAIADRFELDGGVLRGTLNGGAGNDVFDLALVGVNTGTLIDGGLGLDSLVLNGGDAAGLMIYTAAAIGGEFDYSLADTHFKVSHQAVETIRDNSRAQTLEIRGSSQADSIGLANGSFRVNGGDAIEHANKTRIAVRSGINDTIEINDHLVVADRLTLANGAVVANDPVNSSITTAHLVLDATRDVGLANARLRTSVDELSLLGSVGDTYLQEQNGLNLAEFNANGAFDLLLLNGDLTNSAPLAASDVFRVNANNGDITLSGDNELRDDVALFGRRVELHNASTLTLTGVTAEDLILRTQRGIEGDGPLVVSGLTEIDAQGDVRLDFASNDFNRVRVTNAGNLTLVDQNSLQLLDVNASGGAVVVRSANHIDLSDSITGGTGVNVTSGSGSINQNGSITTGEGSVAVSAGNGAVNLADDARIVSNGGSVTISAGNGNVNMGADTRIAANGGNVNIEAAESVVVAEVVSTGSVAINAGSGSITDGNGGTTNVVAGALQSSSNTGFGSEDSLETQVGSLDITTNTGNVSISNKGDVTVEAIRTDGGNIAVTNEGNVDLTAGAVSASNGEVGGDVSLDVSLGSVKQSGPSSIPAITGGAVSINAPEGAVGEGGLRVFADVVRVTALVRGGEIFVNPGADKIEYFSGSFKFEDQLLAVEPLDDIDPAIFSNVRTYFYNDISLLLPSDQRFDEEEEEAEE